MGKSCSMILVNVVVRLLITVSLVLHCADGGLGSPQVPALFVFGDSLLDNGNNNYLSSLAKANYMPYGIDFFQGPSGRFSNGKTIVDFLGELLGLPYIPAYSDPLAVGENILRGVNYASAAGGILEESGQFLGGRFSLTQQVLNFISTRNQLRIQMSEMDLNRYLAKSIVVMALGNNDYINNYLLETMYATSSTYKPQEYAQMLITRYTRQILALYNLGLRKFLLGGVGPLGCIPNQLATGAAPPGKCVGRVNEMVSMFNERLRALVDKLNDEHSDATFVYGNTYGVFWDILNRPATYGFNVSDRGCCGLGRNQGQVTCLPLSIPCANRNEYVFWDAFHPTQAVNGIIAQRAYTGPPSDCYPINVQKMVKT